MKHTRIAAAAVLALGAALGHPGAAQAQQPTLPFTFTGPGESSVVTVLVSGKAEAVYAGRYHATINGLQSNIFCTDFNHEINTGDSYAAGAQYGVSSIASTGKLVGSYYTGGLASALNANDYAPDLTHGPSASQRADEVAWLADNYLGATAFTFTGGLSGTTSLNDNLAGVSLAIWDIVQDGGTGFGAGQVQLTGANAGYFSGLGSYYENLASGHGGYTSNSADWLQAPRSGSGPYDHKQDYVTLGSGPYGNAATPAPEPSSVAAFAFTGLGAAGLVLKARRRSPRCGA